MRAAADEGYITATAVADALVRRGVAFRVAHHVVGVLVATAEAQGVGLEAVDDETIVAALRQGGDPDATRLAADPAIGAAIRSAAGLQAALDSCDVVGGTAPVRVSAALIAARRRLDGEVSAIG